MFKKTAQLVHVGFPYLVRMSHSCHQAGGATKVKGELRTIKVWLINLENVQNMSGKWYDEQRQTMSVPQKEKKRLCSMEAWRLWRLHLEVFFLFFFFTWKFIYFLATGLFCTLKFYFAPVFFFLYLDVFVFVFLHLDVFVVVFLHLEVEPEDGRLQPVLVLDQRVMPQSVRIGLKIGFN